MKIEIMIRKTPQDEYQDAYFIPHDLLIRVRDEFMKKCSDELAKFIHLDFTETPYHVYVSVITNEGRLIELLGS